MKTSANNFIKREVVANVSDSDEVMFLCGMETLKDRKMSMSFTEDRLRFDEW